jgi:hypothetical protein
MSDKRQKNQLVLAFPEESRSEAPTTSEEGTESLAAKRRTAGDRLPMSILRTRKFASVRGRFATRRRARWNRNTAHL